MNHGPIAGLDLPYVQVWNGQLARDHDIRSQHGPIPQPSHTFAKDQEIQECQNISSKYEGRAWQYLPPPVKPRTCQGENSPQIITTLEEAFESRHVAEPLEAVQELRTNQPTSKSLPFPTRPNLIAGARHGGDAKHGKKPVGSSSTTAETITGPELRRTSRREKDFLGPSLWTGNHLEDQLTDQVVKNGFSTKQQVLNESFSAKPTLLPHFKNTNGLQALGFLFTSVLQQKQNARRMQLPSTFKPPPRVTLTDTKREAWLRDLACHQVPLRRLSRTIPHGIRGKALLDQCIAKKIPISRALWLAKCVGANEIRASKRKGVAGVVTVSSELKWVKEWTATLETFIEDNVESCAAPGANLPYALQISVHFWQEGLLDRLQFLHWQLGYFEKCSHEKLPAVLILIRAHVSKLTADFRSVHRLMELCLQKMRTVSSINNTTMQPLLEMLQRLIHTLVSASHDGLILESWSDHRNQLLQIALRTHESTRIRYQTVIDRNDRLSLSKFSISSPCSSLLRLLRVLNALDEVNEWVPIGPLSSYCHSHLSVEKGLLATLLQWAASDYRDGQYRSCLVIRIILELSPIHGADINGAILEALYILKDNSSVSSRIITEVLAELVQLRVFDCSRYMRWLITIGALNNYSSQTISNRCDLHILIELPQEGLSKNVLQLQGSLLRRIGVKVPNNHEKVSRIKGLIAASIPEIYSPHDSAVVGFSHSELDSLIETSSIAVVSEIRTWVRDATLLPADECVASQGIESTIHRLSFDITHSSFLKLRKILEGFAGFTTLSEIMIAAVKSKDHDLLHSIIDTLDFHFQIFATLGSAQQIYQGVFHAYLQLQPRTLLGKTGISSLIRVGLRVGVAGQVKQQLEQDLKSCDESIGLAAFTPMSDVMSDCISGTESEDEIERLLNTGGIPDAATTGHIFSMIMAYLSQGLSCDRNIQSYCSAMMTKLFRLDQEDSLRMLDEWMLTYFLNLNMSDLTPFFKELVASETINIGQYCAYDKLNSSILSPMDLKTIATKVLELMVSPANSHGDNNDDVEYRFAVHQKIFCSTQPTIILRLLCHAIPREAEQGREVARSVLHNPILISVVRKLLRQDCEQTWIQLDKIGIHLINEESGALGSFVCDVIDPRGTIGYSKLSLDRTIQTLFNSVDAMSLPFFQWALRIIANANPDLASNLAKCRDPIVRACYASLQRECPFWARLISVLNPQLLHNIRGSVEVDLISNYLGSDLKTNQEADAAVAAAKTRAIHSRLDLVRATVLSQGGVETESNMAALLESLKLHKTSLDTTVAKSAAVISQTRDHRISKLEALLELSLIHARSATSNAGEQLFSVNLLGILCPLLCSATTILPNDLLQYLMDVIGTIVTPLSQSSISRVIDDLPKEIRRNPRIKFLLGIQDQPDAWLHITQSLTTSTPKPGSSARPELPSQGTRITVPFPLRRWELLPDATTNVDANDTALSLSLFDARKL